MYTSKIKHYLSMFVFIIKLKTIRRSLETAFNMAFE